MVFLVCLLALAFLSAPAQANTEKVIFTAPKNVDFGHVRPNLLDLHLETLSPTNLALRTALPVAFPSDQEHRGLQSWYLLQTLTQGQRYEVRLCWPATQPAEFWLQTYEISHVLETPSLIQDLAAYTEELREQSPHEPLDKVIEDHTASQSALLLRVWAAADYFTTNQTLMLAPAPVDVDIILDPYLLNVFPRSLVPTAAYIVLLAIGGYYLSVSAWKHVESFLDSKEHAD